MNKQPLKIFIFLALFFINISPALAQPNNEVTYEGTIDQTIEILEPKLNIRIPQLDLSNPEKLKGFREKISDEETLVHVPFLAEYIAGVYRYAVVIASLLSVIIIIVSGLQWTISGGSADAIGAAKKRITNAVIGLILAVGSYSILYNINPGLVEFETLKIYYVDKVSLQFDGEPDSDPNRALASGSFSTADSACTDVIPSYVEDGKNFTCATRSDPNKQCGSGQCLAWVKRALGEACGTGQYDWARNLRYDAAWKAAAEFKKRGKLIECDINISDIKNGDIVFLTSPQSSYINMWTNFEQTGNCTTAIPNPSAFKRTRASSRERAAGDEPKIDLVSGMGSIRMPPVTHVGVFVDGKIFHMANRLTDTPINNITPDEKIATKKAGKTVDERTLKGNFVGGYFIAGYVKFVDIN